MLTRIISAAYTSEKSSSCLDRYRGELIGIKLRVNTGVIKGMG